MDYATVLQIVQITLAGKRKAISRALTREEIEEAVDGTLTSPIFSAGIDRTQLLRDLEERFNIWQDDAQILRGTDGHSAWLPAKRADIPWSLWERYKLFVGRQLPPEALENLDEVTDQVLGELEDPSHAGAWDRRGLVMGHVQSGKTASYVGLICKASDAGYKVVVVLAGLHNNLRSQTQIRLDEGFLGYRSVVPIPGGAAFERTGVGLVDPKPRVDSVTNRTETGDFNRTVAQNFGIHPGGNPLLFVVKKNVSVLRNLLAWIAASADGTDPATGRQFHRNVPLLVIDDEADQASVDTKAGTVDEDGKPDEEHNPTRINELIRRLLIAFDKSAYVGYTATPFANIFIHDQGFTRELGEDLFPRSFIINLSAPSNYAGASLIFGIKGAEHAGLAESDPLPIIRAVEDHAATLNRDEAVGWMPPKLVERTEHVPEVGGVRKIPDSLRKAILSFLISAAVRRLRETGPQFNSMLVHVVRFKAVQGIVREEVTRELSEIKNRLALGDGARKPEILDDLLSLWNTDYIPTSNACAAQLPAWSAVLTAIKKIAIGIEVRTINGTAKDALDYEEHRESGLNVVAIGGDKLSRGLTLEGLTVSYFLRASKMYDTLMQMGRWFGYREKYLDVCRLYTTSELREWFAYIAAVTEELRLEFDYMARIGASPKEFGLKVRSHPALLITSAVKMRSGTKLSLSFSGDISETIIFDLSGPTLVNNRKAVEKLVDGISGPPEGSVTGGYLWRGAGASLVLDFLESYKSHPDATRANTGLLRRYIKAQNEQGELIRWSVLIASSSTGSVSPTHGSGVLGKVGLIERAQYPEIAINEKPRNRYSVRRLVSPSDEARDLNYNQRASAVDLMQREWRASTRKMKAPEPPEVAAGRAARLQRDKAEGLLIIYPLDAKNSALPDQGIPIMGIALSFPGSETARAVDYTVTNIFTAAGDYDSL